DPRLVGMLPYRAAELFQQVRVSFRRWRTASDPKTKSFLEARIIDDAGILAHYIGDATMPFHMSINRNGWEQPENPKGYTREKTLHSRFESVFVAARVRDENVQPAIRQTPVVVKDGLPYIYALMKRSYGKMTGL